MWDDEDNNPYGSFHRRDSESDIQSPGDRGSPAPKPLPHFHNMLTGCDYRLPPSIHTTIRSLISRADTHLPIATRRP